MSTKPQNTTAQLDRRVDDAADTMKNAFDRMPKVDMSAFFALQRANVETMVEAQRVMLDFTQTLTRRQADLVKELLDRAGSMMRDKDANDRPQNYMDEAKAVIEMTMADVKETMDLGVKAQNEVVDLFMKRASQNFEDVKGRIAA